uniref:Uncharacterized protein n=1 Tax=Penaeus semisulcatus majanivirus TaxID=2984274 RepID=A0A9C7BPZ9_9VIRU|nr:MAG: hypothetical protein [Penaeus semisulcatus majanivirus]
MQRRRSDVMDHGTNLRAAFVATTSAVTTTAAVATRRDDDYNNDLCKRRPDLCMLTCESTPQLPVDCKHFPTLYTGYNEYLQQMYGGDRLAVGNDNYNKWNDTRHFKNSSGSSNSINKTANTNFRTSPVFTLSDGVNGLSDYTNDHNSRKTKSGTTEKVLTMDDLLPPVNWERRTGK